ncbi:FAD/NAD(P)-binding protein [Bradyrhizobium sp. U87765 SZCCT0131]|uniref:FAD/NAD(P)-binding protein n=1 Tax=unclassified Bradyrhizobium TaxID=2631580 RepID=UPI001BA76195|nr:MULTISPECIES: FAD/NAD(P)-binding protein [unclassified Bradyrhizobium]MBR1217511.1 FAD/NAD(P)-binding protein [Bradyrhizobium sp. U87765 SZCCT0131]MBR1264891.1 FAD/NAD(P)-binding protein [Bradyrhizobium sp. U87765 SZCCT0134]MBR1304873.1 FAD/NAD(P)-binding protein [Bradyrhizobium sp. U87765 SZCCT0110]MBR1320660.1 FAD/NAD(P)-binding protein [Bradyrhizobium sp. U87765 SZCCT0109]MBR1349080.1 FAD/NAD(P)-binding protein [Bradyrhizobium sp. U87765 SZCCT0048]
MHNDLTGATVAKAVNNGAFVAIVGGGFSAICLAAHLHRQRTAAIDVVVFERATLASGTAFRTSEAAHLLNGPAGNLSAFEDLPDDFADFLADDPAAAEFIEDATPIQRQFVPRTLYKRYLERIVARLRAPSPIGTTVRFVRDEVTDVVPHDGHIDVVLRDGGVARAHHAVLAVGHPSAQALGPRLGERFVIDDPWNAAAIRAIRTDAPVAVIGSGQTASDMVLGLIANGHTGQITLVSRRGLVAQPYIHVDRSITVQRDELPRRLLPLMRWVRSTSRRLAEQGGDWRALINALRPHTQDVWHGFSTFEKRAFLEHLAPFWHMHRTRLPPATAVRMQELRKRGQVRVVAGRIDGASPADDVLELRIRRRGTHALERLPAAAIINCTGPCWDTSDPHNQLVGRLLSSGVVRWDDVRVGIDITPDGTPLDRLGRRDGRLSAIGPIGKGSLLEIIAIRDIRVQCAELASRLVRSRELAQRPAQAPPHDVGTALSPAHAR